MSKLSEFVKIQCSRAGWFVIRYDFGQYTRVDVGYGEC
jgi:hypothetical protein|uniref:Uncharacterized protein n=1 Tax=Caudovirales sp. ctTqA28 TaxID=2826775 RepID=A0A8S5MDN4_9CAUD|nr:MAG TPA: hypothetical protein [Caudovirales sp. ctTqA28]